MDLPIWVANREIEQLRALFNYGIKRKMIDSNPTEDIEFFPVEKRKKYIPPKKDVLKVISVADPETQQYLWTILLTAGRVGEINGLTWDDLGTPIGVIQRIFGHQNRRTTEIYLHSVGEAERNAMNRLEGLDLFSTDISLKKHKPTNMHNEFWHRKVDRPPYKILRKEVEDLGYSGTVKKYGVTDNSIRKWLKSFEKQSEVLN